MLSLTILFIIGCCCTVTTGQIEYTDVDYSVRDPPLNGTANTLHDWFRPIRIHVQEIDLSEHLPDPAQQALYRELVSEAVNKVSHLLQVYPVSSTLRLAYDVRPLCDDYFNNTANLCRRRRADVPEKGDETCDIDTGFKIPEEHMGEFRLYSTSTLFTVDIPAGRGVDNTDMILYISARSLQYCNVDSVEVLAFAKICKRDQFGRPIASFLNVCPSHIRDVSRSKFGQTVLHELLHAVGFLGSSLIFFSKDCRVTDRLECSSLHSPSSASDTPTQLLQYKSNSENLEDNWYEFVAPHTFQAWKEHVNCYSIYYVNNGPTWSTHKRPSQSGRRPTDVAGDHWAWTSMMGSLMSPFVSEGYMQVLDNLTVAWFKDTGWYKVSNALTEPYLWGKNSGCDFSRNSLCEEVNAGSRTDRFLCGTSGASGCHYLHLHKASCTYIDTRERTCQYYKPDPEGECFVPRTSEPASLEEQCRECRCFVSSLDTSSSILSGGSCYRRRCVDGLLEISINSTWIGCPYGQSITVEGFAGTLECPLADVLCTDRDLKLYDIIGEETTLAASATTTPLSLTTTTSKPECDKRECVSSSSSSNQTPLYLYLIIYLLSFQIFTHCPFRPLALFYS